MGYRSAGPENRLDSMKADGAVFLYLVQAGILVARPCWAAFTRRVRIASNRPERRGIISVAGRERRAARVFWDKV